MLSVRYVLRHGSIILGLLLLPTLPSQAGDLEFSADTGNATAAQLPPAWPNRVIVDAATSTLLAIWTGGDAHEQQIALSQVVSFQRARAWEGRSDELIAVLDDGSRVLLARGDGVSSAATLLTAVTARPVVESGGAAAWPLPARADGSNPDTSLALGSVHTGTQVAQAMNAQTSATAATQPATTQHRSQVYDVREVLPDNADANALKPAAVKVAVQQQMSGIRQCYQRAIQRDASLSGQVIVWFLIGEDGHVMRARLRETSVDNVVLEDCIVDQVSAMHFPTPQGHQVVPVSFPFSFTGG